MKNILRLKEVLKDKGVTGKELAEKIGITETSVSRIVKGVQYPKIETLLKISEVLDVDIKELIHSTKEVETEKRPIYIENNGVYSVVGYIDMVKVKE